MPKKSDTKKVDFKESGPYGVGNSVEDIKNLDVLMFQDTD